MVLIEVGPFRLLTDPTLDPRGTRYHFGPFANSTKTESTTMSLADFEHGDPIDVVLVTHHHHADNLDFLGRELLESKVVTRIVTDDRWPEDLATLMQRTSST